VVTFKRIAEAAWHAYGDADFLTACSAADPACSMHSPPAIMIVEDDSTTAMMVEIQLRSLGYQVCGVVRSGEAALAALAELQPDLILMDVILEGSMDGVETALAMLHRGSGVPIVFLTARNDHATMERIRGSMPFGCLIKPLRQEELGTALTIALRGHRLEAQAHRPPDDLTRILDVINQAIFTLGADGQVTFMNALATKFSGCQLHYGEDIHLDQVMPLADQTKSWQDWLTNDEQAREPVCRVRIGDGQERWLHCTMAHTHVDVPQRSNMVLMMYDVTDRHHQEHDQRRLQAELKRKNRALHVLSESSHALQRATSERELFQEVCRLTVALGYRLAWIGLAQNDEMKSVEPVAQAGYGDRYLEEVRPTWGAQGADEGPTGAAIRSGEIAIARDILEDDRYSDWRMEAAKRGYASGIALPIKSGDRVIGALTIYAIEGDAFGADEVDLLRELAENVSYGVLALQARSERQRVEQDLLKAEARYRALVEQIPIVTYVAAADESVSRLYLSPQIAQVTGFHPERWISTPTFFISRLHPNDRLRVLDDISRCRDHGQPLASEYRLMAHDGSSVWVRDEGKLIRDDQGRGQYIQGVMMDITQRRIAEESLHQALATLRAMIDASPLAIYTLDIDGRISDVWNRAATELFGWRREEVIGKMPPFVTADKTAESRAFLARILSGEVFTDVEIQRANVVGLTIDLNLAGAPLIDPDGRVIGAIVMLADISSRKRAEAALIASQRDATLGRMAAVVAHEVNNPLAAIKAWLGLVKADLAAMPDARGNLDMIAEQVDRIARTVRNLLGFARQREAKDGRVPATVLIRTVAALFAGRMRAKNIIFECQIPNNLPMIHGDNDQLQEVLINLLENASQALRSGNRVDLRSNADGQQLNIVVEDNGPGLGADPERLFTPFVTTKVNGTGLGLSVARRICVAHGGSLSAENVDSGGARFSVRLPTVTNLTENV
jgi:PAS domain S-box-containing protein